MSSKSQSERSSTVSSSPVSRPPPRSLIVSKVPLTVNETWLFNHLNENYDGVLRVSRNHDSNGNPLSSVRVDFDFDEIVADILDYGSIYIKDRGYFVRPFWPLICYRCRNEGHVSAECPQSILSERRLTQLIEEQNSSFERLINDFGRRWTDRLSKLEIPKSSDMAPLIPITNSLTSVSQQMNQQNIQMQNQLTTLVNSLQKN